MHMLMQSTREKSAQKYCLHYFMYSNLQNCKILSKLNIFQVNIVWHYEMGKIF